MKLNVDKAALNAAVTVAASATEKRSPTPTLQCLSLRTDGNQLIIFGTDTKVASVHSLECSVSEPGSIGVDAAELVRMVGVMPDGGVTLRTDGYVLKVSGPTKRRFELSGIPGEEMAPVGELPRLSGHAPALDIFAALSTVRHAVFPGADRPSQHMARIRWKDGKLTAAATDGHRMALSERECDGAPFDVVVSGRAIPLALAFLENGGCIDVGSSAQAVYLASGESWQRYTAPNDALGWNIVEGRLRGVVFTGQCRVNPAELVGAIRAIGVAQGDVERGDAKVREGMFFDIFKDHIRVQFKRAADEVPCESDSELSLCIEAGYVVDALRACGTEAMLKLSTDDLDPLGFAGGDFEGLVMPMRK